MARTCLVPADTGGPCPNAHYASDMCSMHYQRWYTHGDPTVKLSGDTRYPVRKTIGLTEETAGEVERQAGRFGVREAEIVRRAIDIGLPKVPGTFSPDHT